MIDSWGIGMFGVFKVALLGLMLILAQWLCRLDTRRGMLISVPMFLLASVPGVAVTIQNLHVYERLVTS